MSIERDRPCLLCTSPIPSSQEDANYAYIAGMADGVLFMSRGERRSSLCDVHAAKLAEVLTRYGLSIEGKALPPRLIPANPHIGSYVHCRKCFEMKPGNISMKDFARLEVGWTELGIQVRCARHGRNLTHIDFQGFQHPANNGNDDAVMS